MLTRCWDSRSVEELVEWVMELVWVMEFVALVLELVE
jgi:hypothetical protein